MLRRWLRNYENSLDHKYKIEYVSAKKFLVVKFLNFVMVDSIIVLNQVLEL